MSELNSVVGVIAILCTIGLPIGFGMYLGLMSIRSKHKENMELIRQGIIPQGNVNSERNKYRTLRCGFICVGIALGIIVSIILNRCLGFDEDESFFLTVGSVLFFLGAAYVAFYLIVRKKEDTKQDSDSEID